VASYRFTVGAQAPLQIQLGPSATTTVVALIREAAAFGETLVGTASDPILVRPSSPGSGVNIFVAPLDPGGPTSSFPIIHSFSTAPTHFTPAGGPVVLPVTRRYVFPRGAEFVIYGSAAALLFATAGGGHTWTGELAWEEV